MTIGLNPNINFLNNMNQYQPIHLSDCPNLIQSIKEVHELRPSQFIEKYIRCNGTPMILKDYQREMVDNTPRVLYNKHKNIINNIVCHIKECKHKYGKHFLCVGKRTREELRYSQNMFTACKIMINSRYGI